jgi:hypothetical protein
MERLSMGLRCLLVAVAFATGCYKLNIDNGQLRCSVPDKKCPSGFHCASDGYCWKTGQDPSPNGSTDMGPADMAQIPPSATKGGVILSGGVSAQSPHYKIIMSTGQPPGGNVDSASSSYKLKSGLPALTQ